jgi:hypothetical protein
MQGGRLAVIEWWNKEVGSKLNVQIVVKTFDTRYDVAQTASLWPGIKAEVKPALLLGLGGPDAAALQQRLPEDKIPMLMSTATYGFGWKPNQWALNLRPTYAHEAGGFLEWFRTTKLDGKRPVNVPEHTLKLSGSYRWAAALPITAQADLVHEGRRWVDPDNTVRLPSWTRVDVGLKAQQRVDGSNLTWRLGVANLFDKRAWREAPTLTGHIYLFPLAERTVTGSLQVDF